MPDSALQAPVSVPARPLRARPPILERILYCKFLTQTEIGVYIGICHHTRQGAWGTFARVSQKRLAADLGIDRRTVRVAIARLAHLGIVYRIRVQGTESIYYPIAK